MAMKLKELRSKSDDEIAEMYDDSAQSTMVGLAFYSDELNRRAYQRATDAALEEARAARKLAKVNMWVAIVAALVALGALIAPMVVG